MDQMIFITTTVENIIDAENIATSLLDQKLMACAQITGPIKSIYRWDKQIVNGQEYILTVKSIKSLQEKVVGHISKIHPYEVPEIIVQRPDYVAPEYASWVNGECDGH